MLALRRFFVRSKSLQMLRYYCGAARDITPEIEINANEQMPEDEKTDFTLEFYEKGSPESGASLKHEDDVCNLMG